MPEKYLDFLFTIKTLFQSKQFDEALSLIEKNEVRFLSPQLLVLRGKCIQLATDTTLPLSEAKESFKNALKLDENYIDAWVELGYYMFCVEDNAKDACEIFEKAKHVLSKYKNAILQGHKQCLEEIRGVERIEGTAPNADYCPGHE